MKDIIKNVLDDLNKVFESTDETIGEWKGEGNLQFPTLLGMIAIKMNWDDKQVKEADPLIRFYIRRNPSYHVTRGAHGGIMRADDKQKKEKLKIDKESIKKTMQAALEAKIIALSDSSVAKNKDENNFKTEI